MHADRGFTAIYRNITRKDDYKLKWLKKSVKDAMESLTNKNSNSIYNIEYIVNPIINFFNDNQENNILAIVMGYNYFYESEEERNYPHLFEKDVLNSLGFLIDYEYKGALYCFGICQDAPYVGHQKSKELFGGRLFQNYVGSIPSDICFDSYLWMVEGRWVDESVIYSIFPEEKITLPKSKINL